MIRRFLDGLNNPLQPGRANGLRRRRQVLTLEGLEYRVVLTAFSPTIYTVTDTSDLVVDTGSLAYAVSQANANPNPAGSEIQFSTPLFSTPQTITLSSPLELSGSYGPITVAGPGANLLTLSGNNAVVVFKVDFDVTADIVGVTILGGNSASSGGGVASAGLLTLSSDVIAHNSAAGAGGGVFNSNAPVTINDCTITNNTAASNGGGVFNDSAMTLSNSTISSNTATSGDGGGIFNNGYLTATYCTIAGNNTSGGHQGGGIYNSDVLVLAYSTVANNGAGGNGAEGGGIFNNEALSIADSTIADNIAAFEGGGIFNNQTLSAVSTTIADNLVAIGGSGGGLFLAAATTTTLDDTIVALNTHLILTGAAPDDIAGTVSTTPASAFNLIGTGGSGGLTNGVNGNQVGVTNPGLGSLANNGGPTETIALLTGSPAVDTGDNALDGLAIDQRGLARIYNNTIDIGAYELQPAAVTAVTVYWGAAGTAALQTAPGGLLLLPAGRSTDMPWFDVDKLQIDFNEPVTLTAAEVTLTGTKGKSYGPATVTGSGEVYTITFATPVTKPDRINFAIDGAGIASYMRQLDVLPGDFDDNGIVNVDDARGVRNEALGITPVTIFGEILGDGTVTSADFKAVKKLEGRSFSHLPKPIILARPLARERVVLRQRHHRG